MKPPGILAGAWIVLRKDLLLEWRTRTRLNALIFFSLATLLLFSFAAGSDSKGLQKNAAGYLWLAILFASILALGESFRVESENQALDGLRLAPTDGASIFLGKAIGNALILFALSLVLVPIMVALYDVHIAQGVLPLLGVLWLGATSISAPGTIHSAISANARARDVLLPVLLFPLLVPALISCVHCTTLVIEGDPMGQSTSWLGLLGLFNLVYWALGIALLPRVIED